MRSDEKGVPTSNSQKRRQTATSRRAKGAMAALFGSFLMSTATPAVAATQDPYIWIDRVDGHYAVQGRYFKPNSTGHVSASIDGMTGYKDVKVRSNGYFWLEFTRFTPDHGGQTNAHAWIGKADVKASATLPAGNGGTGNGGTGNGSGNGGSGSGTKPTTPPTTSAPKPTTTTTAKPKPSTTTTTVTSSSNGGGSGGRSLVFSDDFGGDSLDGSKWGVYDGRGNQGHGFRRPSAIGVGGGELRITGKGDISGGIASKFGGKYGRWEIRAKVDKGNGYGSGILLWPSSERWPIEGEMDISEVPKGDRKFSGSYFHYGSDNTVVGHREDGDFSQWHTYAMDWDPGKLTYYVDGRVVFTVKNGSVPSTNHFLALQFDVGAKGAYIPARDASTPSAVTMHVDYVKVYR
jgi:hypothetical protein